MADDVACMLTSSGEKKKGKENSFGLVNKRFGLLPVWGKSPS